MNLLIGALLAVGGVLAVIIAVQGTQGQFYQVITGQTAPSPTTVGSSTSTGTQTPLGTSTKISASSGNSDPGVTGPAQVITPVPSWMNPFGFGGGRVTSPLT